MDTAVDITSCSVNQLLQLQSCCHSLAQLISRRIAQMPAVSVGLQHDACPKARLALTSSSLEAHSNSSSRSGIRKSWQVDNDLGLWQAVQQELFPKSSNAQGWTEFSSREDSTCVASPEMLSVVTALSDGGTMKGPHMYGRSSSRTQASNAVEPLSQAVNKLTVQYARCRSCSPARDKSADFSTPVSSICGETAVETGVEPCVRQTRLPYVQGSTIPVCKPVTPIPECNSSLETSGSTGYGASAGTVQPQSGRLGTASSADAALMQVQRANAAKAIDVLDGSCFAGDAETSSSSSGSCSSTPPPCKRGNQRQRDSSTPPVKYGFPDSPNHPSGSGCSDSSPVSENTGNEESDSPVTQGLVCGQSADMPRKPASAPGPRVPTGLLTASLSQANSDGTSPQADPSMALGLTPKNRLAPRQAQLGTSSAPTSCVARTPVADVSNRGSDPRVAMLSVSYVSGSSPSTIPPVLMAEMACMGFHRPLRVGSKPDLTQADFHPNDAECSE